MNLHLFLTVKLNVRSVLFGLVFLFSLLISAREAVADPMFPPFALEFRRESGFYDRRFFYNPGQNGQAGIWEYRVTATPEQCPKQAGSGFGVTPAKAIHDYAQKYAAARPPLTANDHPIMQQTLYRSAYQAAIGRTFGKYNNVNEPTGYVHVGGNWEQRRLQVGLKFPKPIIGSVPTPGSGAGCIPVRGVKPVTIPPGTAMGAVRPALAASAGLLALAIATKRINEDQAFILYMNYLGDMCFPSPTFRFKHIGILNVLEASPTSDNQTWHEYSDKPWLWQYASQNPERWAKGVFCEYLKSRQGMDDRCDFSPISPFDMWEEFNRICGLPKPVLPEPPPPGSERINFNFEVTEDLRPEPTNKFYLVVDPGQVNYEKYFGGEDHQGVSGAAFNELLPEPGRMLTTIVNVHHERVDTKTTWMGSGANGESCPCQISPSNVCIMDFRWVGGKLHWVEANQVTTHPVPSNDVAGYTQYFVTCGSKLSL